MPLSKTSERLIGGLKESALSFGATKKSVFYVLMVRFCPRLSRRIERLENELRKLKGKS